MQSGIPDILQGTLLTCTVLYFELYVFEFQSPPDGRRAVCRI